MMTRFPLAALLLCASSAALAQSSFTAPDGAVITYTPPPVVAPPVTPPPPPPVVPPPVTPPPVAGTFWVYHNGVFSWLGSYDYNGKSNTRDTSGVPMDGPYDISFTASAAGGAGWQPFDIPSGSTGSNQGFNVKPYTKLHFCIKPTKAGDKFGGGFAANNDAPDGAPIQIFAGPNTTKYGPVPTAGVWGCYTIPLADFGLTNPLILKFGIATDTYPDLWYMDDVGFIP